MRNIVEEREAKSRPVTQVEMDELDLKIRSLKTQLRKQEETKVQLQKQKRELDDKMQRNESTVSGILPFIVIIINCQISTEL